MYKLYSSLLLLGILLTALSLTSFSALSAQRSCAAHDIHEQRMNNDPAYAKRQQEQETKIQQYLRNRTADSRSQACANTITVPIAVHYQNATNPDVSCLRALAIDQIRILNEDFQGTNADLSIWTNNTSANYSGINSGEFCVEFVLATRNHPAGFGISDGDPAVTINATSGNSSAAWANYFNIFVRNIGALGFVEDIGGQGLGDGMTIDNNAFGSAPNCNGFTPSSPYNLGRTLTHELGHYLNLRHIWGDGGCGVDDLVNDTPVSDGSNSGCPGVNTISCGSRDLYMNYMDYTNDACMYMFTAGQAARMEAHFMTSLNNVIDNADNTIGPAVPRVQFAASAFTLSEGTSNCNDEGFRVVPIEIEISDPPSATTTVSIFASGSAISGLDYQLSTTSVTFPAGASESQFIDLIIFEDGEVETAETLNLSFALNANGGDAVTGTNSSQAIVIANDDFAPVANANIVLLEQDFNAGIGEWTIIDGGTLGETWKLATSTSGLDGTTFIISDSDAPGNGSTTDEMLISPVFNGNLVSNLTLSLDQYIRTYNLGGNEVFEIDIYNGSSWVNIYRRTESQGDLGAFGNPNRLTLNISNHASSNNQIRFHYVAAFDWYWVLDNIRVTGATTDDVQMQENTSAGFAEQYFGPQSTIHFYDQATGLIMLSLTNNSDHDFGCTKVEVERGAGANPGAFLGASNFARFLTDKMFKVTPENNSPNDSYSVALYYDAAEISGWEAESGEPRDNLVIVKAEESLLTATLLERAESTLRSSFGTNFSFSADFTTGFSSFALGGVSSALPVEFGRISAEAAERSIFLNWITLSEYNSDGFEIRRSTSNQRGFEVIGWVNGQATTQQPTSYLFEDVTAVPGQVYYYQLRQLDFDRSESFSAIVSAEISGKGTRVNVFPNPAVNHTVIEIASQSAGKYTLLHADGRVVASQSFLAGYLRETIDLSRQPTGVYYVTVETASERTVHKLIKQ